MADQLGMFAKYWQPGAVKTRLAATIGNEAASQLYKQFIETLLRRFDTTGDRRVLAYAPADRREEFVELTANRWALAPQSDGDLGERMSAYFDAALASGSDRAVLIGSDSPTLPAPYIREAFLQLGNHDVVLGPSDDGGYYLIGICKRVPGIFDDIAWSTSRVWQQTIERLGESGASYFVLPSWYDVDDNTDLDRLCRELIDLALQGDVWSELSVLIATLERKPPTP